MAVFSKHQSSVPSKKGDPVFSLCCFLITNYLSSSFYGRSGYLLFYVYVPFGYPVFLSCLQTLRCPLCADWCVAYCYISPQI